jgi:23S rRNA pseudouridine2605 synthase
MPSRSASPPKPPKRQSAEVDGPERLQKLLAAAGLGSRRQCEDLILSGRVEIDRRVVTELGTKADPQLVEIRVDGTPLPRPRLVYFLVNKPNGVVSTNSDPSGRPRVIDLVDYTGRLFTVGRLDMSSEGLILVTNDGELANRLTHPRYGVEKTYQVEVAGKLERQELDKLHKGVHLAEGFARVVSAKIKHQYKQSTLLEIVLNEGRNREIRRLLARVGHKAMRLKRTALGPLRLADLPLGHVRPLLREEIKSLRQAARGEHARPTRAPRPQAAKKPLASAAPARAVIGGDDRRVAEPHGHRPRKKTPAVKRGRTSLAAKQRRKIS